MDEKAQTREHALLLKALVTHHSCIIILLVLITPVTLLSTFPLSSQGVNQIIVVVNKMDSLSPAWSQERFSLIEGEVRSLLTDQLNFGAKAIRFVPVSGLRGENLVSVEDASPLLAWYNGPTLLEAMNSFKEPVRQVNKPLRAVITAVLSEGKNSVDVSVKVLQGKLLKGRGLGLPTSFGNSQYVADVKKINGDSSADFNTFLKAGDVGELTLLDRFLVVYMFYCPIVVY
jgi:translation elongation factor EF-1alpha